ncbi:hypothetical protein [Caproiciproducens faecalis]|uniref:ABC-2 family transporter protein n=1 Tax=Caproiciproducens faecalis TaxID=2820301 RepID=A0ABS7DPQ4_9FIRM|nr:hypothetical protein [Caproiciproducens faecalis]MBW7573252.1 hypothetical protein [Caproiciproducens faecalis]
MLKKLLKYEIEATARIFLPMYALLIVFALINKFFIAVNADYLKIPQVISATLFVAIIVGICVMTLVVTIQRYNKNLLSDEGYLSFTLPVKTHTHIDCKMIVSLMWAVLSVLTSLVSILVLAANDKTMVTIQQVFIDCINLLNKVGPGGYMILLESLVLMVIGVLSQVLSIYAAITIGNLSSKHKILLGIGAYLGFGVIEQIITSVLASSFEGTISRYFESLRLAAVSDQVLAAQYVLLALVIYMFVFGAAYYFLTNWLLKKKLNLE